MGWTYTYKPDGVTSREFLRRQFEQDYVAGEQTGFKVLSDTATLSEYFAIVERTDRESGKTERRCLVCLIRRCGDHHNFGWKDMDESWLPYVTPPRSFFRVLEQMIPEPPCDNARQWRACRAHYEKLDATPNFASGQEIELYGSRFRLLDDLKRSGFRALKLPSGDLYRIKRTQLRSATLITPAPTQTEGSPCS
jgi:hypothetical protein